MKTTPRARIVLVMPDGKRLDAFINCLPEALATASDLPVTLEDGRRYMSRQVEPGVFVLGEAIPAKPLA